MKHGGDCKKFRRDRRILLATKILASYVTDVEVSYCAGGLQITPLESEIRIPGVQKLSRADIITLIMNLPNFPKVTKDFRPGNSKRTSFLSTL